MRVVLVGGVVEAGRVLERVLLVGVAGRVVVGVGEARAQTLVPLPLRLAVVPPVAFPLPLVHQRRRRHGAQPGRRLKNNAIDFNFDFGSFAATLSHSG